VRPLALAALLVTALVVVVAGCGGLARQPAEGARESPAAESPDPPLEAPEGYRAVLQPATWALERVAPDGAAIWIRVAKSGCNDFHHAEVTEAEGEVRVTVFDRVLIPVQEPYGCLLYLRATHHRVALPRPLGADRVVGECAAGDATPEQRICALMHEAAARG
jgi:hypothetical protein